MRTACTGIVVGLIAALGCNGGAQRQPAAAAPRPAAAVSTAQAPASAPGPALPPPAPALGAEHEHAIDRGVLRGLMIEGQLSVTPDDGTLAAMRAAGKTNDKFVLDVCLAPDGTHSVRVVQSTMFRAFNNAVSAALRTWKFRPYVRDGVPARACAQAVFWALDEARHSMPRGLAHLREALPAAAVELPANVIDSGTLEPGTQRLPPAPGLAIVRVCRTPGRTTAAQVTFLQSSGDAAVDRELLDRRIIVPAGEAADAGGCLLRTALARPAPTAGGETPQNVAPTALEAHRTAGDKDIFPSDAVREAVAASGNPRFSAPTKICIDQDGTIVTVAMLKTSGYLGYDADVLNGVATWRYRPFLVNGVPTPVCSAIMFVYKQQP